MTTPLDPPEPTGAVSEPHNDGPLVDVRTAVIFLIAVFIGLVAGGLTRLDGSSNAMAALAGVTACGVSMPVLHKLIAKR